MKVFLNRFGFWIVMIACVIVYLALAYKNPFKTNSLISNLEPYPDTLLYSFPAWNWVRGNGWKLGIGEEVIRITVPNTYGLLLVPLMKIFGDIRSFYFTNLIFGVGSLIFFMLALKNFVGPKKWYLVGYFGFLLATNFYFFNQPQLVMAENLNYLLVSIFVYLLSLKFKWTHLIPIILLSGFALLVKETNLVLGGSFILSFVIKILVEKKDFFNFKKISIFALIFGILAGMLYLPKLLNLNGNIFNFSFFKTNFNFYFTCLRGGWCRNLWYSQKIVTWDLIWLFALGAIVMLANKNKRVLFLVLIQPIILLVAALSLFIDTEGRHIEILIPIILVIGCFGLDFLVSRVKFPFFIVFIALGVSLFLTGYQTNIPEMKIISLKKQVGLNFRHREDPWNYLCLNMVSDFMNDKPNDIFGSFLPRYFFDAYGVKLNYLPLSKSQDFMLEGRGLQKYYQESLKKIYSEKLDVVDKIYLSDYYASNGRDLWRNEWNEIVSIGKLEKVWQSPLDNCNIYKLTKKEKN